MTENLTYGVEDTSFQAAGGTEGIYKLVNCFFDYMETTAEAKTILEMHPDDLSISRDKLYRFLCGWLGGPKLFRDKYGPISIPKVHGHLDIHEAEKNAWLNCMYKAIDDQDYSEDFKLYLKEQIAIPAEKVRQYCEMNQGS